MKNDSDYLRHILDAIIQIKEYVGDSSFEQFEQNRLVQDAVIRQLAIIGEAARLVSSSLKETYPEVPWADIVGMRNILIHNYLEVDIREVWQTIQQDLPILQKQVARILSSD
jgi:uncharacterized protein with HEPN domain